MSRITGGPLLRPAARVHASLGPHVEQGDRAGKGEREAYEVKAT
jgi:hypothetical protein